MSLGNNNRDLPKEISFNTTFNDGEVEVTAKVVGGSGSLVTYLLKTGDVNLSAVTINSTSLNIVGVFPATANFPCNSPNLIHDFKKELGIV